MLIRFRGMKDLPFLLLIIYKKGLNLIEPKMVEEKSNNNEKTEELIKYRTLVLATIDYYTGNVPQIKTAGFDSEEYYKSLKIQAEECFRKGKLTKLKQWFRDLTEIQVETRDLKFNNYLREKTSYDIDIFGAYFTRIEKIIEKGKITTDNQFYDIAIMVDQLCRTEPPDTEKIELLNKLSGDYEQRRSRKTKINLTKK
jgi:hypothetical protein